MVQLKLNRLDDQNFYIGMASMKSMAEKLSKRFSTFSRLL